MSERTAYSNSLTRRRLLTAVLAIPVFGHAGAASAAPRLIRMDPSPSRISLRFNERLLVRRSWVRMTSEEGERIGLRIGYSSNGKTMFAAPARRLSPGVYQVVWRALGQRGPWAEGSFDLTVGR